MRLMKKLIPFLLGTLDNDVKVECKAVYKKVHPVMSLVKK